MALWQLLVVSLMASQAAGSYDCRRPNQECLNGGTCSLSKPYCDCPTAYGGDDCGLDLSLNGTGSCLTDDLCESGQGICYPNATNASNCYCRNDFYGDNCDHRRFDVTCGDTYMVIGINPYGGASFSGDGFIEGKLGTEECELKEVNTSLGINEITTWEGYYIKIDHDSPECGSIEGETNGLGQTVYTRVVVVKYSSIFLTSLDDRFTVKCTMQNESKISTSVLMTNSSRKNLNEVSQTNTVGDLLLYVLNNDGELLKDGMVNGSPIEIGTVLAFYIGVTGAYSSMLVEEVVATDSKGDSKLIIVQRGCMHPDSKSVMVLDLVRDLGNDTTSELKLKAFLFDNDTKVIFHFTVRLCVEADHSNCDPVACQNGSSGYGRRKRDAKGDVMQKDVLIRMAGSSTAADKPTTPEVVPPVEECNSKKIIATLIAMATLMFFLVVACVSVLGYAVGLRRDRNKKSANSS